MTQALFRQDAYLAQTTARVLEAFPAGDKPASVVMDRTLFYAQGGGQPGDSGVLEIAGSAPLAVTNTIYAPDRVTILHQLAAGSVLPASGTEITQVLDWKTRFQRMKTHTSLHLLTAVLPYPVTGGAIGDGEGRLDFDIPLPVPGKEEIEAKLAELIARNMSVSDHYITDEELSASPGLIKTMSVKPPMGLGRVRLVKIGDIDLQPCGGTHVRSTGEIGRVLVTAVENKGKLNRRVRVVLG